MKTLSTEEAVGYTALCLIWVLIARHYFFMFPSKFYCLSSARLIKNLSSNDDGKNCLHRKCSLRVGVLEWLNYFTAFFHCSFLCLKLLHPNQHKNSYPQSILLAFRSFRSSGNSSFIQIDRMGGIFVRESNKNRCTWVVRGRSDSLIS